MKQILIEISPIIFIVVINILIRKLQAKAQQKKQSPRQQVERAQGALRPATKAPEKKAKLKPPPKLVSVSQKELQASSTCLSKSISLLEEDETEDKLNKAQAINLKEAIVYHEIFSKPLALREDS